MKDSLKVIGSEALYLLVSSIVAGIAALIQLIGRTYVDDYSSFIFSGSNYRYNAFFYILGLTLFVGFMLTGYRFFLKEKISGLRQSGVALKIVFPVIAVVFALLILAVIVLCYLLITGLNDNMKPEILFQITGFGWPIFSLVLMIIIEVLNCRT